jgi:hypothetical protein
MFREAPMMGDTENAYSRRVMPNDACWAHVASPGLSTTVLNRFCQKFKQLVHTNSAPHCLPSIVDFLGINWSSCHTMHLLRARAIWVHASFLSSGMHGSQFSFSHLRLTAHEVDSLENADTSSLETLELNSLLVFTSFWVLQYILKKIKG